MNSILNWFSLKKQKKKEEDDEEKKVTFHLVDLTEEVFKESEDLTEFLNKHNV